MREIYGLSFILIEFYIPVSTPILHFIETALHLSAKIIFAVCRVSVVSKDVKYFGAESYIHVYCRVYGVSLTSNNGF
jgi:hypothetical protein